MIGYGLTLPILPFLVEKAAESGSILGVSPAIHVGLITGIYPLMQFLSAPFWGRWSDYIGRSSVLAIGMGGYALALILFGWTDDLVLLYSLRVISGLFSASVLPTVNSWVSDMSPLKIRGKVLAWVGGSASLGVIFGPVLSSFFMDIDLLSNWSWKIFTTSSYTVPFFIAGILSIIALATVLIWLPAQAPPNKLDNTGQKSFNILKNIKGEMTQLLILAFIAQIALSIFETTFALHSQKTLAFGVYEMGFIFMICALGMSLSQIGMSGFLIDHWGEYKILPIGFLFLGLSQLQLMLANNLGIIIIVVSFLAVGIALIAPSLASLTSKIDTRFIGERMGVLTSISSLGLAFGSFAGAGLYTVSIHLPYILTAILVLLVPAHFAKKYLVGEPVQ